MSMFDGMELSCEREDPRQRHIVMGELTVALEGACLFELRREAILKLIAELEEGAWRSGADEAMAWAEYEKEQGQ